MYLLLKMVIFQPVMLVCTGEINETLDLHLVGVSNSTFGNPIRRGKAFNEPNIHKASNSMDGFPCSMEEKEYWYSKNPRKFIFQPSIFRGYVSFREGTLSPMNPWFFVENGELLLKGNDPIGDTPIFNWTMIMGGTVKKRLQQKRSSKWSTKHVGAACFFFKMPIFLKENTPLLAFCAKKADDSYFFPLISTFSAFIISIT